MSLRDLYPRLGAYILGWFTTTPGDNHQLGSMFSVQAGLYLPGLLRHHHLLLRGGWQEQQPGLYYMSINRLLFPRGYSEVPSAGIRTFSADYAFPVAYPDFSAGPVIYLKRIRMDLFYDRSYGHNIFEKDRSPYTGAYTSTGGELYADFHAGRIIFPVSAGVRVAYLFNSDRVYSEFLFRFRVQ